MKDRIIQLHKEGHSFRRIAQLLECSTSTIWYHISSDYKTKRKEKIKQSIIERRALIKNSIIQAFGGKCCGCGYHACAQSFDLHHNDPLAKEDEIAKLITRCAPLNRIIKEVKKCTLLCANCHREVHAKHRQITSQVEFNETEFRRVCS